jgi:hypothetical protein
MGDKEMRDRGGRGGWGIGQESFNNLRDLKLRLESHFDDGSYSSYAV